MGSPSTSISDSLADAEWETLAYMLKRMDCGIAGEDPASRKLRARLGMVRMLMSEEITRWNGDGYIELSFLIASFKAIRHIETDFTARGVKKSEFLAFLRLLLYKFNKQKIRVRKPLATQAEFGRMKGVVENEHGII